MSAPHVKGWCPGALRPMLSGDGLVLRIRPRLAQITVQQAQGIADLASRHGNGFVQLTNRANLQIRGIVPRALPAVTEGLTGLGLLDATPQAEAARNIVVTPFYGDGRCPDTPDIAARLADQLSDPAAPALPGKFGFAVDTDARIRHLAGVSADIRIETACDDLIVRADGATLGRRVGSPDDAVAVAMDLAAWFVTSGGVGPDGRGRMRDHLARGAVVPQALAGESQPSPAAAPRIGACGDGVCVGFAFGQVPAEALHRIADRMRLPIRITPWRSLFLPDTALPDGAGWHRDIITSAGDPRLRVTACTGAPGCPQAQGDTRDLARLLAGHLPPGTHLHVSGCTKGCAHPGPSDLTVVATPAGYNLIRNGCAAAAPQLKNIPPLAIPALVRGTDAPSL